MTHKPTDLLARIDEALAGYDGELSVGATSVLRACRDEITTLRADLDDIRVRLLGMDTSQLTGERGLAAATMRALLHNETHLHDLLARIHGDDGSYTAEHGLDSSCADADLLVARRFSEWRELRSTLREVWAHHCNEVREAGHHNVTEEFDGYAEHDRLAARVEEMTKGETP